MQRSKFCGSINSEKKIKASNEWWLIEINVMKESEKKKPKFKSMWMEHMINRLCSYVMSARRLCLWNYSLRKGITTHKHKLEFRGREFARYASWLHNTLFLTIGTVWSLRNCSWQQSKLIWFSAELKPAIEPSTFLHVLTAVSIHDKIIFNSRLSETCRNY